MKKFGVILGSILSYAALANPIDLVGKKSVTITTYPVANNQAVVQHKIITVLKLKLSPEAKLAIKERIGAMQASYSEPSSYRTLATVPTSINLGMSNVPVLDQGMHGSCVTFAVTGAINAALGIGNYISQLCSLELGSYLVSIRKSPYSGWNGSFSNLVLNQLYTYGMVPMNYQTYYGCGGLKNYPKYSTNIGKPMSIAQYTALSKPLSSRIYLTSPMYNSKYYPTQLLNNVKAQLRTGRRVVFGVLLDDTVGNAGALGTYRARYDSWVLTSSILTKGKKGTLDAGHEMIIVGYSDYAVVPNASSALNKKGILILRNSWGPYAGDKGNYYMTYEYFKALAMDAQVIMKR